MTRYKSEQFERALQITKLKPWQRSVAVDVLKEIEKTELGSSNEDELRAEIKRRVQAKLGPLTSAVLFWAVNQIVEMILKWILNHLQGN